MEQILFNRKALVFWHFKKCLGPEKLVRNIFLSCVGLRVIGALAVNTTSLLSLDASFICMESLWLQELADGRHDFS